MPVHTATLNLGTTAAMVGQYTCTHTTHTLLFIVLQIESFVVLWIVCGALQMGLLLTRDLRDDYIQDSCIACSELLEGSLRRLCTKHYAL